MYIVQKQILLSKKSSELYSIKCHPRLRINSHQPDDVTDRIQSGYVSTSFKHVEMWEKHHPGHICMDENPLCFWRRYMLTCKIRGKKETKVAESVKYLQASPWPFIFRFLLMLCSYYTTVRVIGLLCRSHSTTLRCDQLLHLISNRTASKAHSRSDPGNAPTQPAGQCH